MPEATNTIPALALLGGARPLPSNIEAEKAVLGCLLFDPELALEPTRAVLRESKCFYDPRHQRVYAAILSLCEASPNRTPAIDVVTVRHALEASGELEAVGGDHYLIDLNSTVPTAANVEHYIDIVHQKAVLRQLITVGSEIVQNCFEQQQAVPELIDRIESEVMKITESHDTGGGITHVGSLVYDVVDYLDRLSKGEEGITGIPTGYESLDDIIMGLRPTEMIVLAARPSIGKTALALNIAENIAMRAGLGVGIFSLEMGTKQLVLRLLSSLARVNMREVRHTSISMARWNEIGTMAQRLKEAPIYIDDSASGLDIIEIRSRARRMKADHNIQALVIDYLQLIRPVGGNKTSTRENEVAAISGGIKSLARELNIPIIVLAQLNRQAEQTGAKPKLSHLRESGAIEQDADIVMLLHRERDVENKEVNSQGAQDAEIIIAKNRNGETGMAEICFLPAFTRFENKSRVSDADAQGAM
ncbi:MAG: replicative DNA helicase [Lentisphaeria bacterium]|nr:replicative DNA helicase [Lentisphaeria bacterium]